MAEPCAARRDFSTTSARRYQGANYRHNSPPSQPTEIWRCKECTELNAEDCSACLLCGADRPVPAPAPPSRPVGSSSSSSATAAAAASSEAASSPAPASVRWPTFAKPASPSPSQQPPQQVHIGGRGGRSPRAQQGNPTPVGRSSRWQQPRPQDHASSAVTPHPTTAPAAAAIAPQETNSTTAEVTPAVADDPSLWSLPGEFMTREGVRMLRWMCHCSKVNTSVFGEPSLCSSCKSPFSGLRPWLCLTCGVKNPRQRSTCFRCNEHRVTAVVCRQCAKPSSVFKRWCGSCKAWGTARYGSHEPLMRRTYSCPSCGAVGDLEFEDPNVPKGARYYKDGNVCCLHCSATFSLESTKRRTNELPEIPHLQSSRTDGSTERMVPFPRHQGRLASVTEPLVEAQATAVPPAAASAMDSTNASGFEGAAASAAALQTEWLCSLCGTSNAPDRAACEQCFEPRPPSLSAAAASPAAPPQAPSAAAAAALSRTSSGEARLPAWTCSRCQTSQPGYAARCGSCGTSENPQIAKLRGSLPDWKCSGCTFENFGSRAFCRRCKAPRPALLGATSTTTGAATNRPGVTPASGEARLSWRCTMCHYSNLKRATAECLVCGMDPLSLRGDKNSPKLFTLRTLTSPQSVAAALEPLPSDPPLATASGGDDLPSGDHWTCTVCEHSNAAAASVCVMCDGARPAPATALVMPSNSTAEKYSCPFCHTTATLPKAAEGATTLPPLPNCAACGRHPTDVKSAVWFCGDTTCAERSALETTAPNQREDGATLLSTMGTWNAASRVDCNRCGVKRDPAVHSLFHAATRCTVCSTENVMSSTVTECVSCGHGPLRRVGDYTCIVCKADNYGNRLYCRACHRQRNPRYAFVDLASRRVRASGGLPDDDQWARASVEGKYEAPLRETATSVLPPLEAEVAAPASTTSARRWSLSSDDDDDLVAGTGRSEGLRSSSSDAGAAPTGVDSGEAEAASWKCRLCGERNSPLATSCSQCGIDQ